MADKALIEVKLTIDASTWAFAQSQNEWRPRDWLAQVLDAAVSAIAASDADSADEEE